MKDKLKLVLATLIMIPVLALSAWLCIQLFAAVLVVVVVLIAAALVAWAINTLADACINFFRKRK